MFKKAFSGVMLIMIIGGIVLSISNFLPPLEASKVTAYGTTTWIPEGNPSWWTWLYDQWFCVNEPSNCCIVIEY